MSSGVVKKKHVSKKNKKAWRKHCDTKDVEDFLEDQRLEERLGKFEVKPDNELFMVDTAGEIKVEEKPVSARLRKRALTTTTPKCFEILLPTSKVPDPNAKRNIVNLVGAKATALSKLTEKRRLQKGYYQKKNELVRKNQKLALENKKKVKQSRQNFELDLWGEKLPESKVLPTTLCEEFISREAQLHNEPIARRLRPKPPLSKTVVTRAAVEAPHPGISYNPTYKEHQELLQDVVQHEQKMMKREAHLHRVTTAMFSKVTAQMKENQWREEMSVGLPRPGKPDVPTESPTYTDGEYKSVNPPVKNKKKDQKARRKQRERLVENERLKRKKIDKRKIDDIYKLRKLQSNIYETEKRQADVRSKRSKKKELESATALPKLNASNTPRKEPDFVEAKQLTGDLRNVPAHSHLLRDRYESLQRRGALAGAKVMMKKKAKFKSYYKPGRHITDKEIEEYLNRDN